MVRTQIQLSEDSASLLKLLAHREGISIAELIRRCIDQYLRAPKTPTLTEQRQKALSVIGIAASGVKDLSENHDYYLAEIYGNAGR